MKKLLKQVLSILGVLVIMAISTYASKRQTQDNPQVAPSADVSREAPETVLPNAGAEADSSATEAVKSSEDSASVAAEKPQLAELPSAAPVSQAPKKIPVKQKSQGTSEDSGNRPAMAEASSGWTTIPPPDFKPKGKWHRSNLERHWEKHQAEFPEFHSEQEYGVAALYFLEHPPKGTLAKTNRDGDKMFYHEESNTFGVMTSDGTAKTMFRPSAGINYWRRQ
ncbi:MAG: hypothetical protein MJ202_09435 [Lentisphaeria bacterium]|nr:hypothetical protein [Lentisphaeria bacterium]